MSEYNTRNFFSDGVAAKQMELLAGNFVVTHKHKYDHLSILAEGKCFVEIDGHNTCYTAPACINIKANHNHSIHAVEDCVWYCIHATSETDVAKLDKVLIAEGV